MADPNTIQGFCAPGFEPVRVALAVNLTDCDEIGEAVSVSIEGETVVDLWGGWSDRARATPWAADTAVCVFSVGKPIAALPLLILLDRGELALDDLVVDYWPEYGQAGKAATTIDHVLSRQAGVPGIFDAAPGSAYDWDAMVAALAAQAPLWPPGETGCYHTFSYGYLVGEIVCRVSGRSLGEAVREEIARPFGIEVGFGLDAAAQARVAEVVWTPGDPLLAQITDPETLIGRCWSPLPLGPGEEDFNSAAFRAAEMPVFNCHATARGVAALFGLLANGGERAGKRLWSEAMGRTATTERWRGVDALGLDSRMARGFRLSNDYAPMSGNVRAFGHTGIGGALGFADPDRRLGFAFTPNRLAPGPGTSPYGKRLVDALMDCLS